MSYAVRSRKFCCCLPVRFGVFCESILGIAIGGFLSVAAFLELSQISKHLAPRLQLYREVADEEPCAAQ